MRSLLSTKRGASPPRRLAPREVRSAIASRSVRLALDNRELVHGQPVIGVRVIIINQEDMLAADGAIPTPDFDRHALDQVSVQPAVFLSEQGRFGLCQLRQYLCANIRRQGLVEPRDGGLKPASQAMTASSTWLSARTVIVSAPPWRQTA